MIGIGARVARRFGVILGAAAIGLGMSIAPAAAQDVPTRLDELTRVYEQILQDPGNPSLNTVYARLAVERGELRKALAAYERILAQDPDNAEARAGLERVQRLLVQDVTLITLVTGAIGETNPRHGVDVNSGTHDGLIFGRILVNDTRRIGEDFRLRTEADVYANWHFNFHDLDFGALYLRTGPYLNIGQDWALHAFFSGGYSWLEAKTFTWQAGGGFTLENLTATNPTIYLTVRGAYDFITETFTTRDGWFIEVNARFTFKPVIVPNDTFAFNPYYRYNGVTGTGPPTVGPTGELFPLRFHQFGARLDYFVEVAEQTVLNLNFTGEYRYYYEGKLTEPGQRRDVWIVPGIQLIFSQVLETPFDVIASFAYEKVFSNDPIFTYHNYIVGVRLLWRL